MNRFVPLHNHTVWRRKTKSGFTNRVFVMYHATRPGSACSIVAGGGRFNPSPPQGNMLGAGVYASHTYKKAFRHGQKVLKGDFIVFKLLVYVGRVCRIFYQGDPNQKSWRTRYSSAWVKPKVSRCLANSGLQENCIKSARHVRVLGVCFGYDRLPRETQRRTAELETPSLRSDYWGCIRQDARDAGDDPAVRDNLRDFLQDVGVLPFRIKADCGDTYLYLADNWRRHPDWEDRDDCDTDHPRVYWVRSGDNCLENVNTGHFLTFYEHNSELIMNRWMAKKDDWRKRAQRWVFTRDVGEGWCAMQSDALGGVAVRINQFDHDDAVAIRPSNGRFRGATLFIREFD